jgi:hypothetical protein
MADIIINVDTEHVVKSKHLAYYVDEQFGGGVILYTLHEVIERWYVHPNSEGQAIIPSIEVDRILEVRSTDRKAPPLIVLKAAMDTVDIIQKEGKSNDR